MIAQVILGTIYDRGQGVPQDYATAAIWYRKAADQGIAVAQYSIGMMCREGQGVPRDYGQASAWFRKAADQGQVSAQFALSDMYSYGQGVPHDYVQALKWLDIASLNAPDTPTYDIVVQRREVVLKMLAPDQIAEAQRMAQEWKPK